MPEYLAPGVYVEETSFRAKTIEGVSTSTAGFVGPARFGPVEGLPELVTSFAQYERVFGSLDQLEFEDDNGTATPNFLAQGVRTFFENGGQRLYVSRIFQDGQTGGHAGAAIDDANTPSVGRIALSARFPGRGGEVQVTFSLRLGQNVLRSRSGATVPGSSPARAPKELQGVSSFELVEDRTLVNPAGSLPSDPRPGTGPLYWVERRLDPAKNGPTWDFTRGTTTTNIDDLTFGGGEIKDVRVVSVSVEISYRGRTSRINAGRSEVWENLTFHPSHLRSLFKVFGDPLVNPSLASSVPIIFNTARAASMAEDLNAVEVAETLLSQPTLRRGDGDSWEYTTQLVNGSDGVRPASGAYQGVDSADPNERSGLRALATIQDISIVAAPGHTYVSPTKERARAVEQALTVAGYLIAHAERMRYRIAVLDSVIEDTLNDVRRFRAQLDSTRAALYYPWVRVLDPVTEEQLYLPPSGFVTGVYARNDVEFGVHKSPANEIARGALGFEKMLGKPEQDVLNPEGINCFRFFEGRGYRLWGARTATSDPEWKYVNVRRYFLFLERSVDVNTQWVVFENNGPLLWAKVRRTVEDFLFNEWKSGHLLGEKPEQAYFVKCDLTTMTQNDLDNGRLICLVGVAPLRPAEFVIFRIGQKTLAAQTV